MQDSSTSTQPFFSVVIPVYGTELYLEECLKSVKNQTFNDWECIVVSDCSPGLPVEKWVLDGSFQREYVNPNKDGGKQAEEIFQIVAKGDSRFQFIKQSNTGVGGARNNGISKAIGKHLVVIDSDDYIDSGFLSTAFENIATKKPYEVLFAQLQTETNGGRGRFGDIVKFLPWPNNLATMLLFPTWTLTPINYFWSLELIRKYNLKYPTIRAEDTFFVIDNILAVIREFNQIKFRSIEADYIYRQFDGQVTRSDDYEIKLFKCMVELMKERVSLLFRVGLKYGLLGQLFVWRFGLYRRRLMVGNVTLKRVVDYTAKLLTVLALVLSGGRNIAKKERP